MCYFWYKSNQERITKWIMREELLFAIEQKWYTEIKIFWYSFCDTEIVCGIRCEFSQIVTFKENKFDLVFSIGVLHHLHHWRGMIKQMVKCSSSFTIFDIRLTNEETLDNAKKYYQFVTFDDKQKSKTAISYLVKKQTCTRYFHVWAMGSKKKSTKIY